MDAPRARFRYLLPLAYAVAGIAWVVGSDVWVGLDGLPLTAQLANSAKGIAFVLASALLLLVVQDWPRTATAPEPSADEPEPCRRRPWRPALIFLILGSGVCVGGYTLYEFQAEELRHRASANLDESASQVARQIEHWLADRRGGLEFAGSHELFVHGAQQLRGQHVARHGHAIDEALDLLRTSEEFERVQLFTLAGEPLLHSGGPIAMSDALRRWIRGAEGTGRVVMSDLYAPADVAPGELAIDLVATLQDPGAGGAPVAVLVARVDPHKSVIPALRPRLADGPVTRFALVRRDGDGVKVLLTHWVEGRERPETVAHVAGAFATGSMQIVAGRRGVFEAADYRGVPVLLTGRPIAHTAWHLVAKVERDAVHAPLARIARLATVLGLAGLLAAALLVAMWWQTERRTWTARLGAAELRLTRLQQHFAIAGRMVHDIVLLIDTADMRIVEANDRALEAYGYTREELLGRNVRDLQVPGSVTALTAAARFADIVANGSASFDVEHARKDGTTLPLEISARTLEIDGRLYVQGIGRDTSERLEQERRLAAIAADRDRALGRLQLQFDRMAAACMVLSPEGRLLQVNPAFERTFGYAAAQVTGLTVTEILKSPRFCEEAQACLARLAREPESTYGGVHENVAADGRAIVCRWNVAALHSDGAVHGFIAMADDISELVKAERALRASQERYRALTNISPVGIYRADLAGRIVFANPRAREITGVPIDAPIAAAWMAQVHPEDAATVRAVWSRYVESGGRHQHAIEFRMVRPDDTTVWVLAEVTPERGADGQAVGYIGTMTDITAVKQAQFELQQAHDLLEQRVRERTRELEAAKDAAEHSDRLKTAFLSTMSHELRTPLNPILGFTDVLLQELSGPLSPEQSRQLRIVRDSATRLQDLVENVLDVSLIEAGQVGLEYAEVDLGELLRRRVEGFAEDARRKGVRLALELPAHAPTIRSDARRVEQIVDHLVSNAVKFTDQGEVVVALGGAHGRLEIAVTDTGVGIPAFALAQIFDPFVQVARPGGKLRDGTGLGLSIARNLARALGGDVAVVSEPGRGSCFTLWLPAAVAIAA